MDVSIKNLSVAMSVKNSGVEFEVRSNAGQHLGDLIVSKSKLVWCEGRTQAKNGKVITWDDFRNYMNSL